MKNLNNIIKQCALGGPTLSPPPRPQPAINIKIYWGLGCLPLCKTIQKTKGKRPPNFFIYEQKNFKFLGKLHKNINFLTKK